MVRPSAFVLMFWVLAFSPACGSKTGEVTTVHQPGRSLPEQADLLSTDKFAVSIDDAEVWLSADRRNLLGIPAVFGDGTLGLVKINGAYQMFGAVAGGLYVGGANGNIHDPGQYSAYTQRLLISDLNLASAWSLGGSGIETNIYKSNGGNDFDRNYAGGGPALYDEPSNILLTVYHGEHWYNAPQYVPFTAGLGLAVSVDRGAHFRKLGQILAPNVARSRGCLTEIGSGNLVSATDGYLYSFFTDTSWDATYQSCAFLDLTVARAKISEVIAAAQSGKPLTTALWKKYYKGEFSSPGVIDIAHPELGGGPYSPILPRSSSWANFPSVTFNKFIGRYVMVHSLGSKLGIGMRFSTDLVSWTDIQVVTPAPDAYYASLMPLSGGDPNQLESEFYVTYMNRFGTSDWFKSNLMRQKIKLSPVTAAPTQNQ